MKDNYHIQPMTIDHAYEISSWTYRGEYAVYSFRQDRETLAELTAGDYFSCTESNGRLIGYFCFGAAARIPTVETDAYPQGFLDIGLGLAPQLCGKGRGHAFLEAGMEHAESAFPPAVPRLTVAAFNRRAISVYRKLGFEISANLTHRTSLQPFYLMVRSGGALDLPPKGQ